MQYSLSPLQEVQSSHTRGEAVVVGDHDRGIQGLEVHHHHRVRVEPGLRLQGQGDTLRGPHTGPLLHPRGGGDKIHGLGQPQHHGFHPILKEKSERTVTVDVSSNTYHSR